MTASVGVARCHTQLCSAAVALIFRYVYDVSRPVFVLRIRHVGSTACSLGGVFVLANLILRSSVQLTGLFLSYPKVVTAVVDQRERRRASQTFRYVIHYQSVPINPLKRSGHYMYRQFNIQQFYVLPTQCIYVFYVDLRTNSDYFPIQH